MTIKKKNIKMNKEKKKFFFSLKYNKKNIIKKKIRY